MPSRRTDAQRRLRARARPENHPDLASRDDYWHLSSRPLHALALLTPLVLLYELGSLVYLTDVRQGVQQTVKARTLIDRAFSEFGVAGLLVPGFLCLTVLLVWHALTRDKWQIRGVVVVGMTLEAALWTLPLLVLAGIKAQLGAHSAAGVFEHLAFLRGGATPLGGTELRAMSKPALATISVGAGIYEELVFRLFGIGTLHFLLRDALRLAQGPATTLAIAITSVAFALYHPQTLAHGQVQWADLAFYTSAGIYFAGLFIWRGFGIVVAAHAIYDLVVLVLTPNG